MSESENFGVSAYRLPGIDLQLARDPCNLRQRGLYSQAETGASLAGELAHSQRSSITLPMRPQALLRQNAKSESVRETEQLR